MYTSVLEETTTDFTSTNTSDADQSLSDPKSCYNSAIDDNVVAQEENDSDAYSGIYIIIS